MKSKHLRVVVVLFVAGFVALSGCAGDGDTTTGPTPTATETATTVLDGSDDGDGVGDTTAASTATTTETATTTARTTAASNTDGFTPSSHAAALREAGSYTISYSVSGTGSESATGSGSFEGTQRVDLETGEWYATMTAASGEGEMSLEYYRPPGSETVYQYTMGQVQETSAGSAVFFNISEPGTGTSEAGTWPGFSEAGSGETDLGSATRYVVDSVDALPDATRDAYDSIESVSFEVWVDDDTGVIARYDYDLEYVQDGETGSVAVHYELSDLGSTTIEEPDWVP